MTAFAGRTGGDPELLSAVAAAAEEDDEQMVAAIRVLDAALAAHRAVAAPGYTIADHQVADRLDDHRRWRRALDGWAGDVARALEAADVLRGPRRIASVPARALTVGTAPSAAPRHRRRHGDPDELDVELRSLLRRWVEAPSADRRLPAIDWDRFDDRREILRSIARGQFTTTDGGHAVRVVSVNVGIEGETELQLLVGDAAAASAALSWTPGTTHGVHTLETDLAVADAWVGHAAERGVPIAVLVDLYDGPDHVMPALAGGDGLLGEAADPSYAERHVTSLRSGVDRLADWTPPGTRVTAVAHSYGVVTLGTAAAAGLNADAMVLLAGPGAGVGHASDFRLRDQGDVWAVRSADDMITIPADLDEHLTAAMAATGMGGLIRLAGPRLAHGPDPTDPDFGARAYRLSPPDGAPVVGHSQDGYVQSVYAMDQLLTIATGGSPDLPSTADAQRLHDLLGDPTYGLGTDATRAENR